MLLRSLVFSFLFFLWVSSLFSQVVVHPNAHAHNDYEHERPLMEGLENGFTSFEADIHLIDGKLYVVHDPPKNTEGLPTLESLYLDPLKKLVDSNQGWVYPGYEAPVFLMIDIKTEAESTYQQLKKALTPYHSILTQPNQKKAVTIFLSGNRPIESVKNEQVRWVGLDGRPNDLGKGWSADLMPVISDNYNNHFKWKGEGKMPKNEWTWLKTFVKNAHREGKKVRFWAAPENKQVWKKLIKAKVDLINTDLLAELNQFLIDQQ